MFDFNEEADDTANQALDVLFQQVVEEDLF